MTNEVYLESMTQPRIPLPPEPQAPPRRKLLHTVKLPEHLHMARLLHSKERSLIRRTLAAYLQEQILLHTGYNYNADAGSLDPVVRVAIRVLDYVQGAHDAAVPGQSWTLLNGGWRALDTLVEVAGVNSAPAENNGPRQHCATRAHIAETATDGLHPERADDTDELALLKATARVLAHSSLATEHPRLIELSRNLDTVA